MYHASRGLPGKNEIAHPELLRLRTDYDRPAGGRYENTKDVRLSPGSSQGPRKSAQILHIKSQGNNLTLREIFFGAVILHSN